MSDREQNTDGVREDLDELNHLIDGMGAQLASRTEQRLRRKTFAIRSATVAAALMLLALVVSVTRAPIVATASLSEEPTFTSFTSAPVLANRGESLDALDREYPWELRDAVIEGTTLVYLFVSASGALENTAIAESSGNQQLDEAALRVARLFRFSAALDGDAPVAAWIQVPITFSMATPPPCARCRGIGPAEPLAPTSGPLAPTW